MSENEQVKKIAKLLEKQLDKNNINNTKYFEQDFYMQREQIKFEKEQARKKKLEDKEN